jgi:hypothetical protein
MIVDELIAGDTLDFVDTVPEFSAADGWVLKYQLVPRFTTPVQAAITLTATTYEVTDFRVQAAAATTAAWKAGAYHWARWVEFAGVRQSLGSGELTVKDNPATAAQGYDGRSHARKVLGAIEAVLEGRATKDQEEYTIEGRSLKRTPIKDLLVLRDTYRTEVRTEDAAAAVAAGLPNPRRVGVRFQRV